MACFGVHFRFFGACFRNCGAYLRNFGSYFQEVGAHFLRDLIIHRVIPNFSAVHKDPMSYMFFGVYFRSQSERERRFVCTCCSGVRAYQSIKFDDAVPVFHVVVPGLNFAFRGAVPGLGVLLPFLRALFHKSVALFPD